MAKDKEGTNIEVYIEDVRLSHPHLWKATTFKGDKNAKPKFQSSFIIDEVTNKASYDKIWDAIEGVQEAKWDDPEFCESDKLPIVDGNRKNKKKFREEYKDRWILTAKNDRRPQVIDRDKTPLVETDGKLYAGCRVDALVRIYALENEWGERVNCSLEIVRFHRDDEAFGPEPADVDNMPDLPEDGATSSSRSLGRGRGRDADSGDSGRGRGGDRGSSPGRGEETAASGRGRGDSERGTDRGRGRGDDTPRRGSRDADAPRERGRGGSGGGRSRSAEIDDVV